MFAKDVIREIADVAEALEVEAAALLAVAEVESGGTAFALVAGRREPVIRFEAHYFDRRLGAADRATAREQGLAAPVAGAVANPKTQAARWRMVEKAAAIDRKAAYESVSWGLGQVMGAHWAWLGYADVDALVAEARASVAGQARLMTRYIDKAGLAAALRSHDWAAFARGYNGPGYARNAYDIKLAAAYTRYAAAGEGTAGGGAAAGSSLLRRGSRGAAVLELQRSLSALGHALDLDGVFGPATEKAVTDFQWDNGLHTDGIAGPKTLAALAAAKAGDAAQDAGFWPALLRWLASLLRR